ncbi:hypothetical protein [Paraburkholderia sp. BCC1884]|uniref:hypothetical protein n=1 Tax=Paraburkholderia sp. BCC1884 TaxID=2562668 RepID=UPI00118385B0|nr:hypothetical protein [Paraburkholderia sp. BCC1884]
MVDQTHSPEARHNAVLADPRIWRWYADLMGNRRLVCEHDGASWIVAVDGRLLAAESAFESAVLAAYAMTRALVALDPTRTV